MIEQARQVVSMVFDNPDPAMLDELMRVVRVVEHPEQTTLCHEGSSERTFYIIVDGEVEIAKKGIGGTKRVLAHKSSGEFFGEMALLSGDPRTADVYTTQESMMVEMEVDAFRSVISKNPHFLDNIMKLINQYRENHERLLKHLIFTSYSRRDEAFAKQLVADMKEQLRHTNISLWFDQLDIPYGADWDEAVEEALEEASAMLLILSNHSKSSKNVKSEWSFCLDEQKVIIPILIDPECKIPVRLRTYQFIDMTNQTDPDAYQATLAHLARAIRDVTRQAQNNQN